MPLAPPVTKATFPSTCSMIFLPGAVRVTRRTAARFMLWAIPERAFSLSAASQNPGSCRFRLGERDAGDGVRLQSRQDLFGEAVHLSQEHLLRHGTAIHVDEDRPGAD